MKKHFIDEALNKEEQLKKDKQNASAEQTDIQKNNSEAYMVFHKELCKLIEKIAHLSSESRKPVVEIGYTHLQGESSFEYFASSYKTIISKKLLIFKKEKIYNWWRRVIVEMSTNKDEVIIKLHEKGISETNITDVIKKKLKTKTYISKLNNNSALWILDYLGYKISAHELIKYIEKL